MDYAVIGGDVRFAYLARMLCSSGADARLINGVTEGAPRVPRAEMDALKSTKNVIMNWPCPNCHEIVESLPPGTQVFFCGPGTPKEIHGDLRWTNLWKDEMLLLENAWLTAEGAICAAMNAGNASLHDCHCLVVGWGRIGRALTELLIGMSARVTVASRSEKGRNGAVMRGAEIASTYELRDVLPGKQIVFSTPPHQVLGEYELQRAEPDALIIDLASPPYGVDLEAAQSLGLRAWREPGLPGRYCPFSAAWALLRSVRRAEKEEEK